MSHAELLPISIEQEMRTSYLDYAMSVIVSRAIPDVTDGLKPVHRRILYAMMESGCDWNRPYRKSARIVGEVMGKYHPHGDKAIYDALVRMAQDFSLRVPLIDGQGNFGSMDGDAAAAMRYTESRLAKIAHSIVDDLDKDTVDFSPNYDGSEKEPNILPAKFPNLLVNGAGGIAVGMATNIPTHNLGEVIDACCLYIDNPEVSDAELLAVIPGPDFPTGGIIVGRSGARSALLTGRGSVIIRGKAHFEDLNQNRKSIVITEVPYQVNKAQMQERISQLVKEKRIEGITEIRDESSKKGVRVVIELRRDVTPEVILNQLYTYTPLQTSFGVNMLALDRRRPRLMNLREVLEAFCRFREEVITRRTAYLLGKDRDRAHILIGLSLAVANIDEVIRIIRNSPDPATAREKLLERAWPAGEIAPLLDLVADTRNVLKDSTCYFTDEQARAILEMRLARLTGLESDKIEAELQELAARIKDYLDILRSRPRRLAIMKQELTDIRNEFATPRRTQIEEQEFESDIEGLIQKEEMIVIVTLGGYIKRVPLATYRAQRRGGRGRSGLTMNEEDTAIKVFATHTHASMMFFSTSGKVYKLKVYKLPLGTPQSKGRALVNVFPLEEGDTIPVVLPLPDEETSRSGKQLNLMLATASGHVRRNDLSDFAYIPSNGKYAIKLEEGDRLVSARICDETQHMLLSARSGKSVRFPALAVRQFKSRTSSGVRGIRLAEGDSVISMSVLNGEQIENMETRAQYLKIPVADRLRLNRTLHAQERLAEDVDKTEANKAVEEAYAVVRSTLSKDEVLKYAQQEQFILTITENGYGKRSSAYEYRVTNRGGSGIVNIVTSERNGPVVASYQIEETDQVIVITTKGTMIRCPIFEVRIAGRNTQGVRIARTGENEKVISVARVQEANPEEAMKEVEEELEAATQAASDAASAPEEIAVDEPIEEAAPDDENEA